MDSPPSVDTVCAAIATLYHNPDRTEKDKASVWLQTLQKSVYAWKVTKEEEKLITNRGYGSNTC
jgi:hypothetical protein